MEFQLDREFRGRALFGHVGICQFEVSAVVFVQPGPGLIAHH